MDLANRSERDARKRLIDPKLTARGWTVVPYRPDLRLAACDRVAIEEYPTADGPADYALVVGGRILGIVEAKRLSLGPQNVLTQAERYARGDEQSVRLRWLSGAVPLLDKRRGDLVPRRPPAAQPVATNRRLPPSGGACRVAGPGLRRGARPAGGDDELALPAAPLPDRGEPGDRSGNRRAQAANARRHGDRDGQDLHDGQRGLPAAEVGRRPPDPLPCRSARARRFENVPILHNAGGWRRAERDFGGKLAELIRQINEAIAA